jgi:hypothetical protein
MSPRLTPKSLLVWTFIRDSGKWLTAKEISEDDKNLSTLMCSLYDKGYLVREGTPRQYRYRVDATCKVPEAIVQGEPAHAAAQNVVGPPYRAPWRPLDPKRTTMHIPVR